MKVKDGDTGKKIVKKANKLPNPVVSTNSEPKSTTLADGTEMKFEYYWATHLNEAQSTWIFELFARNMEDLYRKSEWGYEENDKKSELFATTARFIVVRNAAGKHAGYIHYRFTIEADCPSLYVYELQVDRAFQSKGIGTLLLETVEKVAKKTNMVKVFATVFKFNESSLSFFRKRGYENDENYPELETERDYYILSKLTSKVEI